MINDYIISEYTQEKDYSENDKNPNPGIVVAAKAVSAIHISSSFLDIIVCDGTKKCHKNYLQIEFFVLY